MKRRQVPHVEQDARIVIRLYRQLGRQAPSTEVEVEADGTLSEASALKCAVAALYRRLAELMEH